MSAPPGARRRGSNNPGWSDRLLRRTGASGARGRSRRRSRVADVERKRSRRGRSRWHRLRAAAQRAGAGHGWQHGRQLRHRGAHVLLAAGAVPAAAPGGRPRKQPAGACGAPRPPSCARADASRRQARRPARSCAACTTAERLRCLAQSLLALSPTPRTARSTRTPRTHSAARSTQWCAARAARRRCW